MSVDGDRHSVQQARAGVFSTAVAVGGGCSNHADRDGDLIKVRQQAWPDDDTGGDVVVCRGGCVRRVDGDAKWRGRHCLGHHGDAGAKAEGVDDVVGAVTGASSIGHGNAVNDGERAVCVTHRLADHGLDDRDRGVRNQSTRTGARGRILRRDCRSVERAPFRAPQRAVAVGAGTSDRHPNIDGVDVLTQCRDADGCRQYVARCRRPAGEGADGTVGAGRRGADDCDTGAEGKRVDEVVELSDLADTGDRHCVGDIPLGRLAGNRRGDGGRLENAHGATLAVGVRAGHYFAGGEVDGGDASFRHHTASVGAAGCCQQPAGLADLGDGVAGVRRQCEAAVGRSCGVGEREVRVGARIPAGVEVEADRRAGRHGHLVDDDATELGVGDGAAISSARLSDERGADGAPRSRACRVDLTGECALDPLGQQLLADRVADAWDQVGQRRRTRATGGGDHQR